MNYEAGCYYCSHGLLPNLILVILKYSESGQSTSVTYANVYNEHNAEPMNDKQSVRYLYSTSSYTFVGNIIPSHAVVRLLHAHKSKLHVE